MSRRHSYAKGREEEKTRFLSYAQNYFQATKRRFLNALSAFVASKNIRVLHFLFVTTLGDKVDIKQRHEEEVNPRLRAASMDEWGQYSYVRIL